MTETQFDRRLRDWLADREPGPVPPSLRESSARVAFDTPAPAVWRVWPATVRPAGLAGGGRGAALGFVLLVVGLIVAAAVVVVVGASRTPPPAPVLAAWGSFVVGRPAPAIVMHNVAGTPPVGDDSTFEFDDRAGSVVVVYLPSGDDADVAARDVAVLVAARERTPGVLFLVATAEPAADIPAVSDAADAGIGAVRLPPGWAGKSEAARAAAIVVIGRRGTVAAAFGEALPGPDQLVDVIDREVGP